MKSRNNNVLTITSRASVAHFTNEAPTIAASTSKLQQTPAKQLVTLMAPKRRKPPPKAIKMRHTAHKQHQYDIYLIAKAAPTNGAVAAHRQLLKNSRNGTGTVLKNHVTS